MRTPNFTQSTMHNYRMVIFFMLLLVGAGIMSLWKMPKQEFPEFSMPVGMVVAIYPGASAEQVEQQVTRRLEDYLFSFSEVKAEQVRSTSSDGICSITVVLNDKGAKNPNQVWGRIRDGFPLLQKTLLPPGVLAVALLDNFGDAAAELVVLDSKDKSYRELDEYASRLKDDLQDISGIANLHKQGVLHEQLSIYLDKERMVRFGVNSTMITAMLAMQGVITGGAHVDNGNDDMPIYVDAAYDTERELADQVILSVPHGKIVRLKDVARVVNEYPEVNSYITNNGRRAVLLSMEMQQGGDIIAFGNEVDKRIDAFAKTLPEGVHLGRIANQPSVVSKSIVSFLGDLVEAVAIVVLVMMLLFPVRSAMVAGMSIPLTIIVTFVLMNIAGVPLNNVTLAALIVALGMVVDDSIIVIDGHQQMLRDGHSRWYASVMSAHTYFPSMAIATISICLVFVPTLIFMPELFSNFFSVFTCTLIFALITSLVVAMLVVPMLNLRLLGQSGQKAHVQKESRLLKPIQWVYEKTLDRCFAHPWMSILGCLATVVAGAWIFTRVPQKMIPNADRDQFVVEIYNPNGTSVDRTAAITDSVAAVMGKDKRVVDVTEFVGQLMPRFMVSAPIAMGKKSFSQIIVRTTDDKATTDVIRDYTGYFERTWPDTYVRMYQLSYAFGNGLCVMFEGDGLAELHQAADSVKAFMRRQEGLQWIHDGFGEQQPVTDIRLDPISAAQLGVTRFSVASSMAMHFGGFKTGSIWDNGYEKPVILYTADREAQHDVSSIGDEYVGTTFGGNVPLRQIAQVRPGWREANIMHIHGKRAVTVEADVKPGYSQAKAMKAVTDYVNNELKPHLPSGVKSRPWGAARMNKEIGEPLVKSFVVSLCVILFVMVLNFKRFRLSLLAMAGTLLALPGAALGLWLSGSDFSMTAMLGVFSLLGIVMRNAVIMFDYAEELRHKGIPVKEAALEAGRRRMIPIFLTSATTAVGVLPLMLSKSTLWPAMGWIICFGTLTATLLVVTVMPCAYWKLMSRSSDKKKNNMTYMKAPIVKTLLVAVACTVTLSSSAQTTYTLQQAMETACDNNAGLRVKRLNAMAAREQKKELYTKYFPDVSASATYFERNAGVGEGSLWMRTLFTLVSGDEEYSAEGLDLMHRGVLAGVRAIQPIYTGGRLTSANRMAAIGEDAADEMVALQQDKVKEEIEKYFWQLVQLYEAERALLTIDSLVSQARHDAKVAFKAGVVTVADTMQVDIYASKLRSTHLQVDNGKQLCKEYLAYLIGVQQVDSVMCGDIYKVAQPDSYRADPSTAVMNRHESRLLQMQLDAAKWKRKFTMGSMLPTVGAIFSLNYHYLFAYNDQGIFHSAFDTHKTGWLAVANVSVPITAWWGGKHSLRRADINIQKAQIERDDKRRLMEVQISMKWSSLNERYKQIDVARQQLKQAMQNQKQQAVAYRSGAITMTDRLQADALYEQSRSNYIDACVKYRLAIAEYMHATGR